LESTFLAKYAGNFRFPNREALDCSLRGPCIHAATESIHGSAFGQIIAALMGVEEVMDISPV
jgi:hypothetical protein